MCIIGPPAVTTTSLKLSMLLEAYVLLCVTEPVFFKKRLFVPTMGKMIQKCAKNRVFGFIAKLVINFF